MSYRNWLYALALGIALTQTGWAQGTGALNQRPEHHEEPSQAAEAQPTDKPATYAQGGAQPATTNPNPTESSNHDRGAIRDDNSEDALTKWVAITRPYISKEDTLAQWIMAGFGVVATFVSVVAVVLIKHTLEATRAAVREASDATRAAQAAVDVTEKTAERQLRAYVGVFKAGVIWENRQTARARVVVRNFGQTPAHNLTVAIGVEIGEREEFPDPSVDLYLGKTDLFPGVDFNNSATTGKLADEEWTGVRNRKIPMFVWGIARYEDAISRKEHITKFRLMLSMSEEAALGDTGLTPCDEGNEAT